MSQAAPSCRKELPGLLPWQMRVLSLLPASALLQQLLFPVWRSLQLPGVWCLQVLTGYILRRA
jgi:hypothetical protein